MHLIIRPETPADYAQIRAVVTEAFACAEHSDGDEQNLIERLRADDCYIPELALVAELDGRIVGQITITRLPVGDTTAVTIGPLAVLPALQGKRIGGKLIEAGHERARQLGYQFCILLGHAGYYPRFGYRPASEFGIRAPFDVPDENYMACNLQGRQGCLEGVVRYPAPWGLA